MSLEEVAAKFRKLTHRGSPHRAQALLAALLDIENLADVAALEF